MFNHIGAVQYARLLDDNVPGTTTTAIPVVGGKIRKSMPRDFWVEVNGIHEKKCGGVFVAPLVVLTVTSCLSFNNFQHMERPVPYHEYAMQADWDTGHWRGRFVTPGLLVGQPTINMHVESMQLLGMEMVQLNLFGHGTGSWSGWPHYTTITNMCHTSTEESLQSGKYRLYFVTNMGTHDAPKERTFEVKQVSMENQSGMIVVQSGDLPGFSSQNIGSPLLMTVSDARSNEKWFCLVGLAFSRDSEGNVEFVIAQ